jgi:hypothetical protein
MQNHDLLNFHLSIDNTDSDHGVLLNLMNVIFRHRARQEQLGLRRSPPRRVVFITLENNVAKEEREFEFVLEAVAQASEEWTCSICKEAFNGHTTLVEHPAECKHVFHNQCLQYWLHEAPTCPLCRKAITPLLMTVKKL